MNRQSIEYVLSKMGITGGYKMSGDWLIASCPLAPWEHKGGIDHRPSFGVRESRGISGVHCFSCGFRGGMLSLVETYGRHALAEGLWSEEDMKQLEDFVLLAEQEDEVAHAESTEEDTQVPQELQNCLCLSHPYFETRKITLDLVQRWRLGYVQHYEEDNGFELHERVLFPVFEQDGVRLELRGVIGRTVTGEDPKYKNAPPKFKKARFLYGSWLVGDRKKIIVVEGPVDCIILNARLEEAGVLDMAAVSLMGADPSDRQLDWLKDNAEEVVCMLDNDPSGKLGIKKLIDGLEGQLKISVIDWPDGIKDPDEADMQAVDLVMNRLTLLEHRLRRTFGG